MATITAIFKVQTLAVKGTAGFLAGGIAFNEVWDSISGCS